MYLGAQASNKQPRRDLTKHSYNFISNAFCTVYITRQNLIEALGEPERTHIEITLHVQTAEEPTTWPLQQYNKHIDISNVIKGHSEFAVEDGNRHTKHFSYNSTT